MAWVGGTICIEKRQKPVHARHTSMLWLLLGSFAITFACTKIIYSDCIHVNDEKIFSFFFGPTLWSETLSWRRSFIDFPPSRCCVRPSERAGGEKGRLASRIIRQSLRKPNWPDSLLSAVQNRTLFDGSQGCAASINFNLRAVQRKPGRCKKTVQLQSGMSKRLPFPPPAV